MSADRTEAPGPGPGPGSQIIVCPAVLNITNHNYGRRRRRERRTIESSSIDVSKAPIDGAEPYPDRTSAPGPNETSRVPLHPATDNPNGIQSSTGVRQQHEGAEINDQSRLNVTREASTARQELASTLLHATSNHTRENSTNNTPGNTANPGRNEETNPRDNSAKDDPNQATKENYVAASNYVRKYPDEESITNGEADPEGSFQRWELDGEYDRRKLYSARTATMIEASDGTKPALAIVLSCNLASRIERALRVGREYRKLEKKFGIQDSKAKTTSANPTQKDHNASLLSPDAAMKKAKDYWIHCCLGVDPIMDIVWVGASLLPPEDEEVAAAEDVELARDDFSTGREIERASQTRQPEGNMQHLIEVANRAREVWKARDRFDDYCHNYDRESRRYVENRKIWDKRGEEDIREEFPRVFADYIRHRRAILSEARESYVQAQDRARDAGFPRQCLRYVESVDLDSEDSMELLEDHASNMRRKPRTAYRAGPREIVGASKLYHPRDRVADWREDVKGEAPIEDVQLSADFSPIVDGGTADIADRVDEAQDLGSQDCNRRKGSAEKRSWASRRLSAVGSNDKGVDRLGSKLGSTENMTKITTLAPPGPEIQQRSKTHAGGAQRTSQARSHSSRDPERKHKPGAHSSTNNEVQLYNDNKSGPTVNVWTPQAGIKFATTRRTRPLTIGVRPGEAKSSAQRIAEVRRVLAQRDSGKEESKGILRVEKAATQERGDAGSKRRREPDGWSAQDSKRSKKGSK